MGYGQPKNSGSIPGKDKRFFSSPQLSEPLWRPSTEGTFPGGKAYRGEVDHSSLCSVEVKNTWIYTSTPPYIFLA
jgi:hypothetical protein